MNDNNKQSIAFWEKYQEIRYDMSKAKLEDVKEILDNYNQDTFVVDGTNYHYRPDPFAAASLNARYKELTGQDHPVYVEAQERILKEKIAENNNQGININDEEDIYVQLLNNKIEIGNHNHVLNRTNDILLNPEKSSLEDISSLLDYYNGKAVLIDGVMHHPFNDPTSADKLNKRYKELTGKNHTGYIKEQEKIDEKNKKAFTSERENQRKSDTVVRAKQIDTMKKNNQKEEINIQEMDNSVGGINK